MRRARYPRDTLLDAVNRVPAESPLPELARARRILA